jgi:hypothetical protein
LLALSSNSAGWCSEKPKGRAAALRRERVFASSAGLKAPREFVKLGIREMVDLWTARNPEPPHRAQLGRHRAAFDFHPSILCSRLGMVTGLLISGNFFGWKVHWNATPKETAWQTLSPLLKTVLPERFAETRLREREEVVLHRYRRDARWCEDAWLFEGQRLELSDNQVRIARFPNPADGFCRPSLSTVGK